MSFYKCGFFHAQWFQIRRNPDLLGMHNKILEILTGVLRVSLWETPT